MSATLAQPGTVLDLGSDIGLRNRWFLKASMSHPAKLHLGLLDWIISRYTEAGDSILDPMAGIGSILYAATLQRAVYARDVEPKWLEIAHKNAAHIYQLSGMFVGSMDVGQADARKPWNVRPTHLIFSPPYGCDFQVKTAQSRHGYLSHKQHALARLDGEPYSKRWDQLFKSEADGSVAAQVMFYGRHEAQIGHFRGDRYWQAMTDIYRNAHEALNGGYMVLVIKDHIKDGKHIRTADDTIALCERLGFVLVERHWRRVWPLSLWQRRRHERGEPVILLEDVLAFRRQG